MVLFATQFFIFVIAILFYHHKKTLIIGGLLSGMTALSTLIHWVPVILDDLQVSHHWIKPHTVKYLIKFTWWIVYDPAAFVIFIVCIFLAMRVFYKQVVQRRLTIENMVLTGWLLIGFGIPLVYSFLRMPLFTVRYCTIQIPAFLLLVSIGFFQIKNQKTSYILTILLTISASIVLFFARPPFKRSWNDDSREFFMYATIHQADLKSLSEDWRETANFFKVKNGEGKGVIFSELAWFHEYYFKRNGLKPPFNPNKCNFTRLISHTDKVWLVLHDYYKAGWPEKGFSKEQRQLIRREFDLQDVVQFRNSRVFLYERRAPVRDNK
jgi:hypothetical protein